MNLDPPKPAVRQRIGDLGEYGPLVVRQGVQKRNQAFRILGLAFDIAYALEPRWIVTAMGVDQRRARSYIAKMLYFISSEWHGP